MKYKYIMKHLIKIIYIILITNITACNSHNSSYTCLSINAKEYIIQKNIDFLNVSHLDESEGCFTAEERNFLDLLTYAYNKNIMPLSDTNVILEAFPTIGPATVNALAFSLIGYENDLAALQAGGGALEELGPFTINMIGIFPVHDNKYINKINIYNKIYEAPVLLENYGIPSKYALKENNPNIISTNTYPPFPEAMIPSIPDWSNEDDTKIINTLMLLGCAECNISENVRLTSYDLSLDREWQMVNEKIFYNIQERKVWLTSLVPAKVIGIYKEIYNSEESGIIPHASFLVHFQMDIDPRDYPLYGEPIPWIRYSYVHVLPLLSTNADITDFPFKNGDILQPGSRIGIIDPYLGPVYELDMNYSVPRNARIAQALSLPVYPEHMIEDSLLDWLIGKLQEENIIHIPSSYPYAYLFYRPTNPRYSHGPGGMKNLGAWRPAAVSWENGREFLNVP